MPLLESINIRILIERLEIEIAVMVESAEFAVEHEAVKIGIGEIKKKLEVFKKNVEELGIQADLCSRDIRRARTVILQRIIKHPNTRKHTKGTLGSLLQLSAANNENVRILYKE